MLLVARLILLVRAFARFVVEGFGTLVLVRRFGADYEVCRRGARLVAPPAPLEARRARRRGHGDAPADHTPEEVRALAGVPTSR